MKHGHSLPPKPQIAPSYRFQGCFSLPASVSIWICHSSAWNIERQCPLHWTCNPLIVITTLLQAPMQTMNAFFIWPVWVHLLGRMSFRIFCLCFLINRKSLTIYKIANQMHNQNSYQNVTLYKEIMWYNSRNQIICFRKNFLFFV